MYFRIAIEAETSVHLVPKENKPGSKNTVFVYSRFVAAYLRIVFKASFKADLDHGYDFCLPLSYATFVAHAACLRKRS